MAYPSVTYTFSNSTTADATQVNQNFTDLINGLSDGTKDLSISALTVAGAATLNGAVNIGNATSDDLTITGYLASSFIPKTNQTYDIGTADLGLRALYLGVASAGALTAKVIASASIAADRIFTIPEAGTDASFVMTAGTQTISGAKTFDTSGTMIKGLDTGDTIPAGYIGETISSKVSTATNVAATSQYHDITTITFASSGIYSLTASITWIANGATLGNFYGEAFFGTTTGNSTAGLGQGDNYWMTPYPPNTVTDCSQQLGQIGSFNSATGVFTFSTGTSLTLVGGILRLKGRFGSFSAGNPQFKGFIIATRIA